MRTIKFRAWDKHQKKMLSLEDYQRLGAVHIEKDGSIVFNTDYRFLLNTWLEKNAFIPMQYTGLKDKNGKEIYEGDILRYVQVKNGKEYKSHYPIVVEWKKKIVFTGFPIGATKNYEVIGDIYQNPELLTPNKE